MVNETIKPKDGPKPEFALLLLVLVAAIASAAIMLLAPVLAKIELLPDQGAAWYYWKLPQANIWSQTSAWGGYFLHQLFIWGTIYWAKNNRDRLRDRNSLHPVNWIALGGTAVFAALHYLQTAIFYDGLAQDMSVFSSQASVVVLLVMVLMMEAPRRGMFWGKGGSAFSAMRPALIKWHGYYFAWAIVYTFWFHPMEVTAGHIAGFFYIFLLMIQAGMMFTRVHTNRIWTFTLEISVVAHAVIVALTAGQEFWPMFLFGFLGVMVITQIHGLGLPLAIRRLIALGFVAGVVLVYSGRGWSRIEEVFRIPVIDYLLVFVLAGVFIGWRKLRGVNR